MRSFLTGSFRERPLALLVYCVSQISKVLFSKILKSYAVAWVSWWSKMGTTDSSAVYKREFTSHKKSMPTVTCACGSEILVVPDLKAMNLAIKKHVTEHRKRDDDSKRLDSLEQFLAEEVLKAACKSNSNGRDNAHHAVNRKPKFSKDTKSRQWTTGPRVEFTYIRVWLTRTANQCLPKIYPIKEGRWDLPNYQNIKKTINNLWVDYFIRSNRRPTFARKV